ncbi:hypothetical protein GWI33_016342 [Rhynchophorus ferrugineus]|uniref:Uncharacterized protein n=1 Tax=Rhynchophorus ferrugineus TaxID=354439 RepID=A0A834I0Z8_RHYFE|nr:hypothetical protein GWI33_016342 [Rhynchophorus ferrugineus]
MIGPDFGTRISNLALAWAVPLSGGTRGAMPRYRRGGPAPFPASLRFGGLGPAWLMATVATMYGHYLNISPMTVINRDSLIGENNGGRVNDAAAATRRRWYASPGAAASVSNFLKNHSSARQIRGRGPRSTGPPGSYLSSARIQTVPDTARYPSTARRFFPRSAGTRRENLRFQKRNGVPAIKRSRTRAFLRHGSPPASSFSPFGSITRHTHGRCCTRLSLSLQIQKEIFI